MFPADEQMGVRRQLAMVLRAIIAQHLLVADGPAGVVATEIPAAEEGTVRRRRVVASEVLLTNPAVANLIATAKSSQIYSTMETGSALGMQTLEQDLARLWIGNWITEATATMMAQSAGRARSGRSVSQPGSRPMGGSR